MIMTTYVSEPYHKIKLKTGNPAYYKLYANIMIDAFSCPKIMLIWHNRHYQGLFCWDSQCIRLGMIMSLMYLH